MEKIRAGVIKGQGIRTSTTYAEIVAHEHGIEESTVESIDPPFTMTHAVRPPSPSIRSRAHYHVDCARALYILKGHLKVYFGPEHDQQVFDVEPGDYIYTPKGAIHSAMNVNPNEPTEWVSVYVGVTRREDSGRVFVEPPNKSGGSSGF